MDLDIFLFLLIAVCIISTEIYVYRMTEKRISNMGKRLDKFDIEISDVKYSVADSIKMVDSKLKGYQQKNVLFDSRLRDYQTKMREDKVYNETNRKYIVEIQDKLKGLNSRLIVIETIKPAKKDLYTDYRDPVTKRFKGSKHNG